MVPPPATGTSQYGSWVLVDVVVLVDVDVVVVVEVLVDVVVEVLVDVDVEVLVDTVAVVVQKLHKIGHRCRIRF
jgi:hypothetical protein